MSDTTVITIKSTTKVAVNLGGVPSGLIVEALKKQGDGTSLTENFSIYDLNGNQETAIDEVTVD